MSCWRYEKLFYFDEISSSIYHVTEVVISRCHLNYLRYCGLPDYLRVGKRKCQDTSCDGLWRTESVVVLIYPLTVWQRNLFPLFVAVIIHEFIGFGRQMRLCNVPIDSEFYPLSNLLCVCVSGWAIIKTGFSCCIVIAFSPKLTQTCTMWDIASYRV